MPVHLQNMQYVQHLGGKRRKDVLQLAKLPCLFFTFFQSNAFACIPELIWRVPLPRSLEFAPRSLGNRRSFVDCKVSIPVLGHPIAVSHCESSTARSAGEASSVTAERRGKRGAMRSTSAGRAIPLLRRFRRAKIVWISDVQRSDVRDSSIPSSLLVTSKQLSWGNRASRRHC